MGPLTPFERVIAVLGSLTAVAGFCLAVMAFMNSLPKNPVQVASPPVPAPTVIIQVVQPAPAEPIKVESPVLAHHAREPVAIATPIPSVDVYQLPPEVKPQSEVPNRAPFSTVETSTKPPLSAVSSALIAVTRFGDHDNVKRLLSQGADPNAAFDDGKTPLMLAAETGHHDICKTLVLAGANTTMTDRRGRNPLHYAAEGGHNDLVQYLLDYGAPVAAIDNEGNTPLMLAQMRGHNTCAAVIQKVLRVMETPR